MTISTHYLKMNVFEKLDSKDKINEKEIDLYLKHLQFLNNANKNKRSV